MIGTRTRGPTLIGEFFMRSGYKSVSKFYEDMIFYRGVVN